MSWLVNPLKVPLVMVQIALTRGNGVQRRYLTMFHARSGVYSVISVCGGKPTKKWLVTPPRNHR